MSTRTWSTRFLKCWVAETTTVYTVPAGKRAIVRCISAYNANASAALAYVQLAYVNIWVRSVPGTSFLADSGLHHVAHSGETISGYIQGPSMHLVVSGYLLEDPLSEPAPNTEELSGQLLPADWNARELHDAA